MEAVYYSKMLVCTYQTIQCHVQEIICMHEPFLKFVENVLDLYFGQRLINYITCSTANIW